MLPRPDHTSSTRTSLRWSWDASGGPPSSIFLQLGAPGTESPAIQQEHVTSYTTDPQPLMEKSPPTSFLFLDKSTTQGLPKILPDVHTVRDKMTRKVVTYNRSPFPRWLPWPRREADTHCKHLTVPRLPARGFTQCHVLSRPICCTNTCCPPEPGRKALADSRELGHGTCFP